MWNRTRSILLISILLVLSALTVYAGYRFEGLSYYIIITLILIYALMIFFVYFEHREHKERELVMISIMCAIAVASRAAFIWVPHFKPMAAVIMICGIGLGAQSGFLVGTLAAFLSNLIFGQGPWTPWQMVAFGIAGLIMGLLADSKAIPRYGLSKGRLFMVALIGALEVLLVTGPVLDVYALTSMVNVYSLESVIGVLLAGVPVNAIQALATFLTIVLLGNPFLKVIHRACVRYGLVQNADAGKSAGESAGKGEGESVE